MVIFHFFLDFILLGADRVLWVFLVVFVIAVVAIVVEVVNSLALPVTVEHVKGNIFSLGIVDCKGLAFLVP